MDLLSLRETLETLLADQLGTYTLANGVTTPALSVRAVGELSPANTTVTGLECVLQKQAQLRLVRQYAPNAIFRVFTVYLISWDGNDLAPAAELVIGGFPSAVIADARVLSVPEGQGPQQQMRIELQFNPDPLPVEVAA